MNERKHTFLVSYDGNLYHTLRAHTGWEAIERTWSHHATDTMTRQLLTATKLKP